MTDSSVSDETSTLIDKDLQPCSYCSKPCTNRCCKSRTPYCDVKCQLFDLKINNPQWSKSCLFCNKVNPKFRCESCKKVYYCNSECQCNDWETHKSFCKKYRKPKISITDKTSNSVIIKGKLDKQSDIIYGKQYDKETNSKIYYGSFKIYSDLKDSFEKKGTGGYNSFDINGKLHFSILKKGYGVEYHENGEMKYIGKFKMNQYNGKGIEYYENCNISYEGQWKDGEANGQGIEYYEQTEIKCYEGQWKDHKCHGRGISYHENGNVGYEGQWNDNKYHGRGIAYHENGNIGYVGTYLNGMLHGSGTIYDTSGKFKNYEGEWYNDTRSGHGIQYLTQTEIKVYEGQWKDDKYHGMGILYHENGNILYKGQFIREKKCGKGIEFDENGDKIYEGQWINDTMHGNGKVYINNVLFYEGQWNYGKPVLDDNTVTEKLKVFDKKYSKVMNTKKDINLKVGNRKKKKKKKKK